MTPEIAIVIPAFEEEARVGESIAKILGYVTRNEVSAEVIVVDDGSRDRTSEVAREAFEKFPSIASQVIRYEENRGKGFAVKTGLQATIADVAVFSDADLSTPIEELQIGRAHV